MFREEQPALGPLPLEPFRYYRYGERTVHLDGCVEVEAAYCGAPPGWLGRRVQVEWNATFVRLLAPTTGQLLREHLRAPRGWERAIAWRTADSFALREFLGLVLPEAPPDHSTISRTRRLIDLETHEAVFTWMPTRGMRRPAARR